MFDDLLQANEPTLCERFILQCVAPALMLTALLHADFDDRPPYLLLVRQPLIEEPFPWPTCSHGTTRRTQATRFPRAPLPACCARSTTAATGPGPSAIRCLPLTGLSSSCNVPPPSGKGCFCTISDSQRASEAARCSTP